MLTFLGGITDYRATLTLMKGRVTGDSEDRWRYSAYAPENVKAVTAMVAEHGKPLLYSFDGLIAAIPQFQLIDELTGKMLGLGDRSLVVIARSHDV